MSPSAGSSPGAFSPQPLLQLRRKEQISPYPVDLSAPAKPHGRPLPRLPRRARSANARSQTL
eukprot:1116784-Amorphochlora_amoeboformis.AAC.1